MSVRLPSEERYERHLAATAGWLVRSFARPSGGSRAHFSLVSGWSRMYPETTGYILPTLLDLSGRYPELPLRRLAEQGGHWLLSLQHATGWWPGGLWPPRGPARASVFNSGQILLGMVALFDATQDERWLSAAKRGAAWLADGIGSDGMWPSGDYRARETPSYYTHVAWPMLEVWRRGGPETIRASAERFLRRVLARRLPNGAFERWGFDDGDVAFTHTIAYTLSGLLESARLLNSWDPFGAAAAPALEALVRRAELSGGSLPGSLDARFKSRGRFVCLTGNAQIAILLLDWERRERDLRIVNAAAKLVDRVCASQSFSHPVAALAGAVGGSSPVWGPYLRLRYPNWAAKYHCDALVRLMRRIEKERAGP